MLKIGDIVKTEKGTGRIMGFSNDGKCRWALVMVKNGRGNQIALWFCESKVELVE